MPMITGTSGDDHLVGGPDNDILVGLAGNDTLDGGGGLNAADYVQSPAGVVVNLAAGTAQDGYGTTDTLINIQQVGGSTFADTISGGAGADTFHISQGAGMDVVTDFNFSEGDRVQLDPGQQYTVSQQGSDVVIDLGGGDEMILKGVAMSSLGSGWIFGF